ncbi:hypothetical protein TraAM80_03179 [Trypanosoma rangeli]|uniref:Uncharacterized protein n=1 Tax=Trypanosoma rangeli TaxID=5698 RepID=A0A3S5IRM9_TRYRA|nr:uncharacterized protein TraAM80_03179 [Trypanosoma rangeli]RNF07732.1 hypothetical protein TraAM80_03179 [Trypanosoma rangeli]|eukprot:RNF07732.1 hypothetical protein TraAM80_03179 [Trypanosoma rangeli]
MEAREVAAECWTYAECVHSSPLELLAARCVGDVFCDALEVSVGFSSLNVCEKKLRERMTLWRLKKKLLALARELCTRYEEFNERERMLGLGVGLCEVECKPSPSSDVIVCDNSVCHTPV